MDFLTAIFWYLINIGIRIRSKEVWNVDEEIFKNFSYRELFKMNAYRLFVIKIIVQKKKVILLILQ